jgi:L,D-peptidoglycan transpeptidase YkuD (ErfK/YbiS/YcfS/YnhG family)
VASAALAAVVITSALVVAVHGGSATPSSLTAASRADTGQQRGSASPGVGVTNATPQPAPETPSSPASAKPSTTATPERRVAVGPALRSTGPKPGVAPAALAARLKTLPASTTQVVIVHAASSATTYATLETFTKVGARWLPTFGAMTARVGKDGIGTKTKEGVPITPIGMFSFGPTMYGVSANPGVHYQWHHLVTNDWWDEMVGSPTYNTFQHGSDPGGASEALWKTVPAYDYFAVITYNMPPNVAKPVDGAGSGIFLHVATSGPTAGCVSLPTADLVKVLTWLDPARNPRIVISLDSGLGNF